MVDNINDGKPLPPRLDVVNGRVAGTSFGAIWRFLSTNTFVTKVLYALSHTGLHVYPRYEEINPLEVIMVFTVYLINTYLH